ncbi:MAG: NAD(P)/FAD-dependent oxidoreductase [Anaerolineae bacterium]|nr:NAD(P)/FAD-dependent oxidoreductase [Anaerolineae bacterium]
MKNLKHKNLTEGANFRNQTLVVQADYLVIGAGAAGMAFVDSLIHNADVQVVLLDRRHSVGGHWLDAYPFVRLHQASEFYGVVSTPLGKGERQVDGPEAGLHERASAPDIVAYYARVLENMVASGRVTFHPNSEHLGGRRWISRVSGQHFAVPDSCRVVNAHYLAPDIPSQTPAPFGAADGTHVIPVNDLVRLQETPGQFVIVGSGKTATDAIVWLIDKGVDPDAICWVRPRDPWMFNRAAVQPDPVINLGMVADILEAACKATSPDDLFLRMEAANVMLRVDPRVTPSMAKTPTLAQWELDRLRTIENVVRLGHVRHVEPGQVVCMGGDAAIDRNALVVHCAASGLQYPPLVPVWGSEAITLQCVATGPIFGAALAGYLEATREADAEKNRLCPPQSHPNTPADWPRSIVLGARGSQALSTEPDVKHWSHATSLYRSRIPAERASDPDVVKAVERVGAVTEIGMARLAELGKVQ